ncbi:hypothetical protein [Streptomyces sp. MMBL 11-1]|uniref:hypothetical protein n=1 Tax=Streptomyces sp. MMBL 11-1 TaxID=3026420 RepID=UPI002360803B|nr:hypothetical protein [Streptomyces sp. MMBL 11-1]
MSYATSRPLGGEMNEGLTDGGYKKINRDRGGSVDPATYAARNQLNDITYGLHEANTKARPDGLVVRTPGYVPNPPAHLYLGM